MDAGEAGVLGESEPAKDDNESQVSAEMYSAVCLAPLICCCVHR